jgi:NAD(P)-dependent dehydrogenase (short-subunit alcohol dehydrogenase family)
MLPISRPVEKFILITGASRGFGRSTVRQLLERGHRVVAGIRGGSERLAELFPSEIQRYGARLSAVDLHLDRPETFADAARKISELCSGRLDVLINNAGYGLFGALEDLSEAQMRMQMEVNFFGPMLLTRALLPLLRKSQGRMINLSSVAGLVSFPFYGNYSASKFALEGFSEGLYFELKPHGVQVCLVEPGGFRTDFAKSSFEVAEGARTGGSIYANRTNALIRAFDTFATRLGDPDLVTRLLVDLCERRAIPMRAIVGTDARLMRFLRFFLPDRIRLGMVNWIYNRVVFKGA